MELSYENIAMLNLRNRKYFNLMGLLVRFCFDISKVTKNRLH